MATPRIPFGPTAISVTRFSPLATDQRASCHIRDLVDPSRHRSTSPTADTVTTSPNHEALLTSTLEVVQPTSNSELE